MISKNRPILRLYWLGDRYRVRVGGIAPCWWGFQSPTDKTVATPVRARSRIINREGLRSNRRSMGLDRCPIFSDWARSGPAPAPIRPVRQSSSRTRASKRASQRARHYALSAGICGRLGPLGLSW